MDGTIERVPGVFEAASLSRQSSAGGESLRSFLSSTVADKVEEEDETPLAGPRERTGTIMSSWTVMANTILGVGMLALPWAACQVGWLTAGAFLFLAAFFAYFSLHLLSRVALELGSQDTTFYSCCLQVAPKWRYFVDLAIAVKCFGVATSYLQVIGQTMVHVFHPAAKDQLLIRFLVILATVTAVAPIAYRRRIGKTRFTNIIAIGGIMYVWVLLIVYCMGALVGGWKIGDIDLSEPVSERTRLGPEGFVQVLTTIPVFIFSFTCHQNLFPVANEIKDPSVSRLSTVAGFAVVTACVMYGACIVLGYCVFGSGIQQNYLLSLPQNMSVTVGSVLMAVANGLSFPLQNHPCRRSLTVLISGMTKVSYEYPQVGERWLRRFLTSFILCGTVLTATMVNDLGIVFEIVGTVGSNTICYIMPALLYIYTFRGKAGTSILILRMAMLQLSIGLVVLPTCLFAIFYKAFHSAQKA